MPLRELRAIFPKFGGTQESITSPIDENYNCTAWVVGDTATWWEPYGIVLPNPFPPYQWPDDLPHDQSPETFIRFFERYGFELTDGAELEDGTEKIALYVREGEVQHTARQLPNGRWTSKIGNKEDVEHSLQELESDNPFGYGVAEIFMKRPSPEALRS